jgi:pilus assembly protein CpaE
MWLALAKSRKVRRSSRSFASFGKGIITVSLNIELVGSTDRQLEDILRACGMIAAPVSGAELAAIAQPGRKQPNVLVLDVRGHAHLPAALPILKRHHPSTGVLIVADRLEPALLLEAMRVGVTEVVAAPLVAHDIEAAINRLAVQRSVTTDTGMALAFVGAKGGVGTTTVAVNVAATLARLVPGSTLLMDLHVANGDAAVFLGAEPRFSIVDALENTHRLDEAFFRNLIVKTKAGVDLLAASERMMTSPLDVRRIRTLLDMAERHYRYVILDIPRWDAAVLDSLEGVRQVVIVTNQELAAVRSASRMAATLRQRHGKDKLTVVISRPDRHAAIAHEDVERAVGVKVKHTFPGDYRRALEALNKGRPLALENNHELSGALERLARSLAGLEKPATPNKAAKGFALFGSRKTVIAGA